LTYDQLRSKAAFFGNGSATVCCEMSYQVSVDANEGLWSSYQQGLFDTVTIQVEGKEFKVVLIIEIDLIIFYRSQKLSWLTIRKFSSACL
jgi:hypothetical protein